MTHMAYRQEIEAEDIDGLIEEIAESTTKRPGEALR